MNTETAQTLSIYQKRSLKDFKYKVPVNPTGGLYWDVLDLPEDEPVTWVMSCPARLRLYVDDSYRGRIILIDGFKNKYQMSPRDIIRVLRSVDVINGIMDGVFAPVKIANRFFQLRWLGHPVPGMAYTNFLGEQTDGLLSFEREAQQIQRKQKG